MTLTLISEWKEKIWIEIKSIEPREYNKFYLQLEN